MADEKKLIQEIMDKCGNIRDPEELARHYNSWAEIYVHVDNEVVSYNGPKIAVSLFSELSLPKEARILNIGAGTGAVGEQLKTRGYTNVDAMDSSPGMLAIAEQKKVYNKLITSFVDKDTKLPVEEKT